MINVAIESGDETELGELVSDALHDLREVYAQVIHYQAEIRRARAALLFFELVEIDPNSLKFKRLNAADIDQIGEFIRGLM